MHAIVFLIPVVLSGLPLNIVVIRHSCNPDNKDLISMKGHCKEKRKKERKKTCGCLCRVMFDTLFCFFVFQLNDIILGHNLR